jgi:molybdopterin molybdotransferase
MSPSPLLPVADALQAILASIKGVTPTESVPLAQAFGRVLASDLAARRTQPPIDVSAMDGYALRHADVSALPARLALIGASAAGHGFAGRIEAGQAVRIFTGAPVPQGADTVIIQENTSADSSFVIINEAEALGRNIRKAGLDFVCGDALLTQGHCLSAPDLALAAAMNHAHLPVHVRPKIAILATGDELVAPGQEPGPDQIVASNSFAVAAYAKAAGADVLDLGIAGDRYEDLQQAFARARASGVDVLVTLGGASVGDHDLVQTALKREGMELGFWKIAMRPGKPLMHGRMGEMQILGLPGNPVSAIVCAVLFLVPLVRALSGDRTAGEDPSVAGILGVDLGPNDSRQDYLRASLAPQQQGLPIITPFGRQDSSMLRTLAASQALLIRAPHAPAARAGDPCRMVLL